MPRSNVEAVPRQNSNCCWNCRPAAVPSAQWLGTHSDYHSGSPMIHLQWKSAINRTALADMYMTVHHTGHWRHQRLYGTRGTMHNTFARGRPTMHFTMYLICFEHSEINHICSEFDFKCEISLELQVDKVLIFYRVFTRQLPFPELPLPISHTAFWRQCH